MSTLKYGSVGTEVETLQQDYNRGGISKAAIGKDLVVDGDFGSVTLVVTHYFQSHSGLADDGIVGPKTKAALAQFLAGGVITPPSDETTYGIDIYHGDDLTSVSRLVASKFKFVMHKATEGNGFVDKKFTDRRKTLVNAGLLFGANMYIHPNKSASSQVDLLLRTIGKLEDYELPVAIDWEEDDGMSNSHANDVVEEMVTLLKAKTGKTPFIYSSWGQLSGYDPRASLAKCPLWVADLRNATAPRIPKPWSDYTFWQYSFTANVPGIGNPCDVNKFQGSLEDLKNFAKNS